MNLKKLIRVSVITFVAIMFLVMSFSCEKREKENKFDISDSTNIKVGTGPIAIEDKIPLDYSVYKKWKHLENQKISNNGELVSFEINPNKGDGNLFVVNIKTGKRDTIARGYNARFSPNSDLLTFKIKSIYDTLRQAKLDDVKKDKLPKDSLGIFIFNSDTLIKKERVKSFKIAKENSSWVVYQLEKELKKEVKKDSTEISDSSLVADSLEISDSLLVADSLEVQDSSIVADTSQIDSSEIAEKKKEYDGTNLIIFNPKNLEEFIFENTDEYTISKNGKIVVFNSVVSDSTDSIMVKYFDTEKEKLTEVFAKEGFGKKLTLDEQGKQLCFIYSNDSTDTKTYELKYNKIGNRRVKTIVDTLTKSIPDDWTISEHCTINFSETGEKLFFGVAKKTEQEPKDTLLKNEKVDVNVWNWKDPFLQTQQLHDLKKDKNKSYKTVYFTNKNKVVQLSDKKIPHIRLIKNGDGNVALGISDVPYRQLISWDSEYQDLYLIDVNSGKRKLIKKKNHSGAGISPDGKYIYWFGDSDSSWYTYSINGKITTAITKNINTNFYDELHDRPRQPAPYGIAGWTENDKYILIYDRYDIWRVDPQGYKTAVNLTGHANYSETVKFRYVKLDKEIHYIDTKEKLLLNAFDEKTKQNGFYSLDLENTNTSKKLIFEDYLFRNPKKAKNSNKLIWQKMNYQEYPELRISNWDFTDIQKLSITNPQKEKYIWGNVELIDWTNLEGEKLQGLLYRPENFDSTKKYPMVVYFYERYSDNIHYHYTPSPSRSTINKVMYPSNGYFVFIPDITYKNGRPGQSAYSCIVSGVGTIIDRYDSIDKNKIGIQGQSWGGYQVAQLVTQTNMFSAGMAGAPVSNMTSAYGGIRWGSGMSRMMQYEKGQSRIGGTLWEKPLSYIENSPLFQANLIETPLLIMHNTNDGAVPWWQGIEFFVALRRLQKPVWMLSYVGDSHNLKRESWGNRVDLSIRMRQFFDHYLKDKPAPIWMEEGIPAVDKGKKLGYELVE
ncbi:MAG: prolyl oligopeptidase family serine peptidase [Candidatus Marinimicrobia bacterium]|nr:prolyl oligopeptidase family serine peptidase [Candidatus Neomarinimicrobiota bacterium]